MSQQTTTQWQAFLDTAKAKYATACDVYQTAINSDAATMESLTAAQDAYNAAGAQWVADQHTANQMAAVEPTTMTTAQYAALDALYDAVTANEDYAKLVTEAENLGVDRCVIGKVIAKAEKDSPNPIVTTPMTAAEVVATINTNEAFGVAWGADGQVLTYTETVEAIAAGRGWFDRQGRWVNRAGWERKIDATIASK